jgi:polysaccharide export outer membrane protein
MTVIQALSASGGLTERGTDNGVAVTRRSPDGSNKTINVKMNDVLQPSDVLIIKASLF